MWRKLSHLQRLHFAAEGTKHYAFSKTGITRIVKTHLKCNTKNVICMIHCTKCNKQHIGETKRRHKDRFNRSSAKSPPFPFLNIISLVPGAYAAFSAAVEGVWGGGVHFKLVRTLCQQSLKYIFLYNTERVPFSSEKKN